MTKFCLSPRSALFTFLFTAAGALAACAGNPGEWTKSGIGDEARVADLQDCELFSQRASLLAANQPSNTYKSFGISSGGLAVSPTTQIPQASTSGFAAQSDALAQCMEARGYEQAGAS